MRRLSIGLSAAFVAAVMVPQLALAQAVKEAPKRGQGVEERQKARESGDQYAPIGARLGSFQLFPAMDVEVEMGDNIFAVQKGGQGDTLTRIKPELALKSDWKQNELNVKATGEVVRYKRFSDDNVENYGIETDGRLDLLRALTVTMGAGYTIGHEDRGDPNAVAAAKSPSKTENIDLNVGAEYKPNKLSASVDATYKKQNFFDVTNSDASITNNDDRDREKIELEGRLGYEFLPDTDLFVKASINKIDYRNSTQDGGANRNSDGFSGVIGTDLDFTGLVTGNVFGGYVKQSYDSADLENIAGPTLGASIKWDATPLITVNGSVARTVQETTTAGTPGFMSTASSISADYEILRELTAKAKVKWTHDNTESIAKDDNSYEFSAGAKYLFNRNYSAGVDYKFKRKISSAAGSSYTQQTALLTLRGQF